MSEWQLQDAKARLSEVLRRACDEGPQTVTICGERAVMVISAEDYDRLVAQGRSAADVLLSGPEWTEAMIEALEQRDAAAPLDTEF